MSRHRQNPVVLFLLEAEGFFFVSPGSGKNSRGMSFEPASDDDA